MNSLLCPVCSHTLKLKYKLKYNIYECANCGLLNSDAKFEHSFESDLESGARDIALKQLRLKNFATIIEVLKKHTGEKAGQLSGLEIGCGNGWWLETCRHNGIECIGIEPEHIYEAYHQENGLHVVYGFYPDVSPRKEGGYDFIIFNDVFEHIPDVNSLLDSLKKDLNEDGMLIINLPMSQGLFYKMATILHKLGADKSLLRMWQFNFHSPHMNYFNTANIQALLSNHGFSTTDFFRLETLDFEHIKERIMADRGVSRPKAWIMANTLKLLKPLVQTSKPDIRAFFFKQKKN